MDTFKKPKGILVAVGGGEDKEKDLLVLRSMTKLIKKPLNVKVITIASEYPEEVGKKYIEAFGQICDCPVTLMHIRDREEAAKKKNLDHIDEANLVFFTGGDQLRITSILGGTELLDKIIRKYYTDKCVIAGTSAGATAMSQTMIYGGESSEALLKGTVHVTTGIGLIKNVVIDTHFIKRGRFSRLMEVITSNPSHLGIGLGEDTGIVIKNGNLLRTIGNGLIVVFEGNNIRHTNITTIGYREAIAVENMHVHTLVEGYGYDLSDRKMLKPEELKIAWENGK